MWSTWGTEKSERDHVPTCPCAGVESAKGVGRCDRFRTIPLTSWASMPHICREGECATSGPVFPTIRGFRQHQNKKHSNTIEEESSLGKARVSKRKRDAKEEEEHEQQRLQVQLTLEAENRNLELELQRPVRSVDDLRENRNPAHVI